MNPDDIRRMYHHVSEATEAEARATFQRIQEDPEEARRMIEVLYSLSVEDAQFALLLRLFLEGTLMRLVAERAEGDDAYALECGKLITELMEKTRRPARGRPGRARSA